MFYLKDACSILGKLAQKFNTSRRLTCNQSDAPCRGNANDVKKLLSAEKAFFSEFKPPHDVAHKQLDGVTSICDLLSTAIKGFRAKL